MKMISKKNCAITGWTAGLGDGAHSAFFPKLSEVFMCEMTRKAGTANRVIRDVH